MKLLHAVVLGLCLISLAACDNQPNESTEDLTDDTSRTSGKNMIEITGEVQHVSLEGGAWIIHGSDSTRYEPLNLADEYKEEGLKVHVVAQKQPDKMSFLQVGPIIEISSIEKR